MLDTVQVYWPESSLEMVSNFSDHLRRFSDP